MKKLFLSLLICVFLVINVGAQEKAFVFGFNVSPNIGWYKSDTKEFNREGVSPGVSWGFIAEFHLLENYSISTGFNVVYLNGMMNYAYKYNIDSNNFDGHLNRKYKLQYLEIPLAFKMKTNEIGRIRIYGLLGLGTSFLIRGMANDEFTKKNGGTYTDDKVNVYDDMVFLRESLIIGAGTEIIVSENVSIIAGVKFNNGFLNIMQEDDRYLDEDEPKVINNFIELSLGVLF